MKLIRQPDAVLIDGQQYSSYLLCDENGTRFSSRDYTAVSIKYEEVKRSDDYRRFHGKHHSAKIEIYPLKDKGEGYWIEMLTSFAMKDMEDSIPIRLRSPG